MVCSMKGVMAFLRYIYFSLIFILGIFAAYQVKIRKNERRNFVCIAQ